MTDFLDAKIKEIRERLDEIRPLVDEFSKLEAALEALEQTEAVAIPVEPVAQPQGDREYGRRKPRKQRSTENKQKILAVLTERPGVTAGEVIQATGVASSIVYSTLNRLTSGGVSVKQALPGGGNGYSLAPDVTAESLRIGVVTAGPPKVKADSEVAYVTQEG